jgi:transketolase
MNEQKVEELTINTIRFLSVDAIEKANSGHPGAPMGLAPIAYVLWHKFMQYNPKDPNWCNRDRFVLSAGHASMLLYSMLYLTGYELSLSDIKKFRQWNSKTAGHPEIGSIPGVEVTTGPLGQGFANGVGMAISERWLAATFNKPDCEIVNHCTFSIVSDGDMMEGITSEAASIAGHLKLGRLIYIYDDNGISIEGNTDITFSEDVAQRFNAYNWQVIGPINGMDISQVEQAINQAKSQDKKPSLIIAKTIIGYGSPNKSNSGSAHGEPLGKEETRITKENLGWDYADAFCVPPKVLRHMRQAIKRGGKIQNNWQVKYDYYKKNYPLDALCLENALNGNLPEYWDKDLNKLFNTGHKNLATRTASGLVLNAISRKVFNLLGGSADLAPSTKTILDGKPSFQSSHYNGCNFHFGVREHSMGAIANGIAVHGGIIPYTATFLVFYDYMRPAVRLAALMNQRIIFIFTHDSIGLGEDGPTHQPIEQLIGLRSVPNLVTIRPSDATEVVIAWEVAIERNNGPTALVLSRQNLPILNRHELASATNLKQGGYVLWQAAKQIDIIIIATGSEVQIALHAARILKGKGISARVVSMPSWELFEAQPEQYKIGVLPPSIKTRISVEAGSSLGWHKYVGDAGKVISIDCFGVSAPGTVALEKFGFTSAYIVTKAEQLLKRGK